MEMYSRIRIRLTGDGWIIKETVSPGETSRKLRRRLHFAILKPSPNLLTLGN